MRKLSVLHTRLLNREQNYCIEPNVYLIVLHRFCNADFIFRCQLYEYVNSECSHESSLCYLGVYVNILIT